MWIVFNGLLLKVQAAGCRTSVTYYKIRSSICPSNLLFAF